MTAQKMKSSIKDFFGKCDQIHRKLLIWSHLLKKSLMQNFIFCAVNGVIFQKRFIIDTWQYSRYTSILYTSKYNIKNLVFSSNNLLEKVIFVKTYFRD